MNRKKTHPLTCVSFFQRGTRRLFIRDKLKKVKNSINMMSIEGEPRENLRRKGNYHSPLQLF